MDVFNYSPIVLKEALKLVEEKSSLESRVAQVDAQLAALLSGRAQNSPPAKAPKRAKPVEKEGNSVQRVASALAAAATTGLTISDLSKNSGVGGPYLNAILGTLVRSGEAIRVSRGVYAAKGGTDVGSA